MRIETRVFQDAEFAGVWLWEVWDADEPTHADGTDIFYGRGIEGTREAAEDKAANRAAEAPARRAARAAIDKNH